MLISLSCCSRWLGRLFLLWHSSLCGKEKATFFRCPKGWQAPRGHPSGSLWDCDCVWSCGEGTCFLYAEILYLLLVHCLWCWCAVQHFWFLLQFIYTLVFLKRNLIQMLYEPYDNILNLLHFFTWFLFIKQGKVFQILSSSCKFLFFTSLDI